MRWGCALNRKKFEEMSIELEQLRRSFNAAMDRNIELQDRLDFQKRLTRRAIRKNLRWPRWKR